MSSHVVMLAVLVDKTPKPNDVKAGWVGFGVFIALAIAVVLLGMSLVKHLRRAETNAESGAFTDGDDKGKRTEA